MRWSSVATMVRRFVELEPAIGSLDHDPFVKLQLTSVMLDPAEVAQVRLLSEQLAQLDEVTHLYHFANRIDMNKKLLLL
ncbi:hypothetical protein P43SY_004943 [Pythium insidiosum]|uniref:Uncharacterized protein n=1 Tax=Pythium insidiosum TaxID=114742 RepID=A0AAD5L745_PYTIN|nr:hypothetical protein P43SY_004943 [Pythium insidiosum]